MVEIYSMSFTHSSLIINIILIAAFILNLIFAFVIIFMERRSAGSIWAWLLVLVFLPIIGFILYLLLGRQIQRNRIFKLKKEDRKGLAMIVDEQIEALESDDFSKGNAKDYIHIQYYIFKSDELGHRILSALEDKLDEGLEVKMLYDDMGSRTLRKKDLKHFRQKGGHVESFFPSKLPLINLRMNNRNHRKIVIIDGKIGYVGGFNVGDEYLGKDKKFGYWRDTHLRLEGDSVNALELRFILDWNSQSNRDSIEYEDRYFPDVDSGGTIGVQIASSGPDEDWEQIKYGYLKMISSAKQSIYIQSPYFIPDQAFIDAIKIAALGGVEVNIMIPNKPDHPFVYWATLKNAASLLSAGVKIYHYDNGFLHSKTLIIDDEIASVGTANMDNRSFTLNFEVNAFIYDEAIAAQLKEAFIQDMKVSYRLTEDLYNKRSLWIKFKEGISQLLSPIL